jgi:hypothetical protein
LKPQDALSEQSLQALPEMWNTSKRTESHSNTLLPGGRHRSTSAQVVDLERICRAEILSVEGSLHIQ